MFSDCYCLSINPLKLKIWSQILSGSGGAQCKKIEGLSLQSMIIDLDKQKVIGVVNLIYVMVHHRVPSINAMIIDLDRQIMISNQCDGSP